MCKRQNQHQNALENMMMHLLHLLIVNYSLLSNIFNSNPIHFDVDHKSHI